MVDGQLKVDFNYKMPSWIKYEREGGKEAFFGFWMSISWSEGATSDPNANGNEKFIDITADGIIIGDLTFDWEDAKFEGGKKSFSVETEGDEIVFTILR